MLDELEDNKYELNYKDFYFKGLYKFRTDEFLEAIELFKASVEKYQVERKNQPSINYLAMDSLAGTHFYIGKHREALHLCLEILKYEKSASNLPEGFVSRTYAHVALIYLQLGEFKLAKANAEKALELKPDNYSAYNYIADTLSLEEPGKFVEAIKHYSRADEIKRNRVDKLVEDFESESYRKAFCYLGINSYEKALTGFINYTKKVEAERIDSKFHYSDREIREQKIELIAANLGLAYTIYKKNNSNLDEKTKEEIIPLINKLIELDDKICENERLENLIKETRLLIPKIYLNELKVFITKIAEIIN